MGYYAPTNYNLKHTSGLSDEEVDKALIEAEAELGMDGAEQEVGEPDTPEEEGQVLEL